MLVYIFQFILIRLNELNKFESEIKSILEAQIVYTKPAIFQQQQAFNSVIPVAQDLLGMYIPN
jgi:hypothetical protein